MEKKTIKEKKENGIYKKVETVETKPKDGFVHEADIHKANINNYGKFHKGYSKSVVFTTNDPKITRPFVYICCALFFIIGIVLLICKLWFMGIIFTVFALFTFIKSKKDIDHIEKQAKESDNYKEKLTEKDKQ